MVDRYMAVIHEVNATARMAATPNGTYVSAADYEKAEARIKELEAAEKDFDGPRISELVRENTEFTHRIAQLEAALRETLTMHDDCICRNRRAAFQKLLGIAAETEGK
jgi:hypothetical protein